MGSIYVIIWGVGKTISWPFRVHRFGGFFGGECQALNGPHSPIHGIREAQSSLAFGLSRPALEVSTSSQVVKVEK